MAGDAGRFPALAAPSTDADGWQKTGATGHMHGNLRAQFRIAAGRRPEPTAAVIDSQSVKAAETVGRGSRGYDAGKKINGRKRHIAVDALGLLLTVLITAAGMQDRDAARPLLWNLARPSPPSGSPGLTAATPASSSPGRRQGSARLTLQVVRRTEQHKFIVLPRRWVVERTFSWITRSRRTVRDYERLPGHHETIVYWAMIIIMSRRLAKYNKSHQPHPA